MTDDMYDDYAIERACRQSFGIKLDVSEVIARQIPTGFTSTATVFKTSPNMVYVFIHSQSNQLLADVRNMLRHMNIEAGDFLPPHGEKDYFKRIGEAKFKAMYPGKHIMSDEDTRYQRTLAPYNPALIRVARIRGEIRGFHFESKSWRKVKDYSFSRINL